MGRAACSLGGTSPSAEEVQGVQCAGAAFHGLAHRCLWQSGSRESVVSDQPHGTSSDRLWVRYRSSALTWLAFSAPPNSHPLRGAAGLRGGVFVFVIPLGAPARLNNQERGAADRGADPWVCQAIESGGAHRGASQLRPLTAEAQPKAQHQHSTKAPAVSEREGMCPSRASSADHSVL